jgi:hypothetical protein
MNADGNFITDSLNITLWILFPGKKYNGSDIFLFLPILIVLLYICYSIEFISSQENDSYHKSWKPESVIELQYVSCWISLNKCKLSYCLKLENHMQKLTGHLHSVQRRE